MQVGGRRLLKIAGALLQPRHYYAGLNMLRVYDRPVDAFGRYLFGSGKYPSTIAVNTASGRLHINAYSAHDVLTINEIFCRKDYRASANDEVVVDFGSNIGISAAYFLSQSPSSRLYLFEPLEFNIERLHHNLRPFEGRYALQQVAVGLADGEVQFGWEDSGRYGGVGMQTGKYVTVKCVDSNNALKSVLAAHGRINILKIDIETLERQVTERIPLDVADKIDKIYVEYKFLSNPLEETHSLTQYGPIAQFVTKRKTAAVKH